MANVVYAPEAENDISNIVDAIARDNLTAARNWLATLRGTCDTLSTQPNVGEMRQILAYPGAGRLVSETMCCSFVRLKTESKWLG